ncbi:hypothetical protein AURDEDRAFT_178703, partial [Auricularia subglabra TFB-10046 SS5]
PAENSASEDDEGPSAEEESESPLKARAKRKRRSSEATKRRKARALANARAKAAAQAAGELEAEPATGDASDVSRGATSDEDEVALKPSPAKVSYGLRAAGVHPLTPSPKKKAVAPLRGAAEDARVRTGDGKGKTRAASTRKQHLRVPTPEIAASDEEIAAGADGDAGAGDFPVEGGGAGEGDGGGDALDAAGGGDMMLVDTEHAQEQEVRLGVRRHTKAVQKELADTARAGALEDLGARMVNMLGQLKSAGIQIDFAGPPTVATTSAQAGPSVAPSPDKAKAYSRAENFKGDGSSREGKPVTEGRKYGAVFGSYDVFDVGLNISDYSRKNNEATRDNTELFYPLVRKAYAMNRFRESYVAVIAMPVSGDLKGQTYAWASPRLLQDLPDFLDDCALEISHGTMDKRAHGYAKALGDYKRKALRDLAELNRKNTEAERGGGRGPQDDAADGGGSNAVEKQPAGTGASKGKSSAGAALAPQSPDPGKKRKRLPEDEGGEERSERKSKVAKVADFEAPEQPQQRRPFTPRNASSSRRLTAGSGRGE